MKKENLYKDCVNTPSKAYNLEYRFNQVDETEDGADDESEVALKCIYSCNRDKCNSDKVYSEVSLLQ